MAEVRIPCRPVRVGRSRLELACSDAEVADRFDVLLAALDDAPPDADVLPGEVRSAGGGLWELRMRSQPLLEAAPLHEVEDRLLAALTISLLADESDRLHLHAGLVALDGTGLLLVGPSGSGKSTLVVGLAEAGWTVYGDELVGLDRRQPTHVDPFRRPVNLKGSDGRSSRRHIPLHDLGPGSDDVPDVRVIALLSSGQEASGPVGPGAASALLVADALDLARAGGHGMATIVRLAASARCHRIGRAPIGEVEPLLRALVHDERRRPAVAIEHIPASGPRDGERSFDGSVRPTSRLARASGVHAWIFQDEVILYAEGSGAVLEADRSAADVWRLLDGSRDISKIGLEVGAGPDAVDGIVEFVAALAEGGFVSLLEQPATAPSDPSVAAVVGDPGDAGAGPDPLHALFASARSPGDWVIKVADLPVGIGLHVPRAGKGPLDDALAAANAAARAQAIARLSTSFPGYDFEAAARDVDDRRFTVMEVGPGVLEACRADVAIDRLLFEREHRWQQGGTTFTHGDVEGHVPPPPLAVAGHAPRDTGRLDPGGLADALEQRWTAILNNIDQLDPGLNEICWDISTALGARINTNTYISYGEAKGFGAHWDSHDTLIVPLHGEKRWTVYEPSELSAQRPWIARGVSGRELWSGVLRPGLALLIPRGWGHLVEGSSELSVHHTIGINRLEVHHLFERIAHESGVLADDASRRPA